MSDQLPDGLQHSVQVFQHTGQRAADMPKDEVQAAIVNTLRVLAVFSMAESAARQLNCRPMDVLDVVYKHLDPNQGMQEYNMAETVDKVVDHIKRGLPR